MNGYLWYWSLNSENGEFKMGTYSTNQKKRMAKNSYLFMGQINSLWKNGDGYVVTVEVIGL